MANKQWEYQDLENPSYETKHRLGFEGWELVSVIPTFNTMSFGINPTGYRTFFKRELIPTPKFGGMK